MTPLPLNETEPKPALYFLGKAFKRRGESCRTRGGTSTQEQLRTNSQRITLRQTKWMHLRGVSSRENITIFENVIAPEIGSTARKKFVIAERATPPAIVRLVAGQLLFAN